MVLIDKGQIKKGFKMIFAANLKCNHTRGSLKKYLDELNAAFSGDGDEIMIFAPAVCWSEPAGDAASKMSRAILGAQNFYPCESGAFTGEIGEMHLREFGIKTVMIGHSERRALGEDDELIKTKFEYAKERGWRVVFCIGESEIVRMNGAREEWLRAQLDGIDLGYKNLIIAYEPIWAIGTGIAASVSEVASVMEFLTSLSASPLLYGGSVNSANIAQLRAVRHLSGVLVGSASWDVKDFTALIRASKG